MGKPLGIVAEALNAGFAGVKSDKLCGLIRVGDSTIGDIDWFESPGGSILTGGVSGGAVAARS